MNQQVLLRQARQMQQEIIKLQQEINESSFEGTAGGVVSVTLKGTKEIVAVKISDDFQVESKDDLEMLQEMIVAASHQAYLQIENTTKTKMGKYQSLLGSMGSMF